MSDLEVVNALNTALAKRDYSSLRTYTKLAREHRLRDPENVAALGAELLTKHARKLPQDELWTLHEQVCVAALDVGNSDLAFSLIKNVNRKFPSSARAARLTALFVEFSGDHVKAESLYKRELEVNPQNPLVLKRMVALQRGKGDLPAAIEALKAYLDVQQADWVAWEELADLYLQIQAYQQAAFCLEEVLLHQPTSLATHLLLADTLYTLGGPANWRTARSYYSAVVEMSEGRNLRALYGVCACAAQLAGVKGRESRGDDDAGLPKLAAEALLQRYAEDAPDKLPLVKAMLKAQGLLP